MADKDLAKKIQEAKAAGYTDEEINAYLNPQPVPVEEKDRSEEYIGTAEFGLGKAAELAAEGYLGYRVGKGVLNAAGRAFGRGVPGPTGPAGPAGPPGPPGPVAPTTTPLPVEPGLTPEQNRAWQTLKSPQGTVPGQPPIGGPAAQQGTTFLDRVIQKYGQASRAMQPYVQQAGEFARTAAPYAKGLVGATLALTPGNIGQNYPFPQTGPLRGSEINPNTGRPWTAQELAMYNRQYQ